MNRGQLRGSRAQAWPPADPWGDSERIVSLQSPEREQGLCFSADFSPFRPGPGAARHTQHTPHSSSHPEGFQGKGSITALTFPRGELVHNLCTEPAQALTPEHFQLSLGLALIPELSPSSARIQGLWEGTIPQKERAVTVHKSRPPRSAGRDSKQDTKQICLLT